MTLVDAFCKSIVTIGACAGCLSLPALAAAQVVEVRALKPEMQLPGQTRPGPIQDATVTIKPNGSVVVKIVDNNPLLLTYSSTVTKEETEQHKTAASFLNELAGWLTALGFKKPDTSGAGLTATEEETLVVEGVNFAAFQKRLTDLDGHLKNLPTKITDSTGDEAAVSELKKEIRGWNAARDADAFASDYLNLARIAIKCLQGSLLQTNQGNQLRCTDPVPLPQAARIAAPPLPPPAPAPAPAAANPPPARPGGNPPPPPGAVIAPVPPSGAPPAAAARPMERGTIESYVALAMAIRGQVTDSAKVVTGFSADVAKLHNGEEVAAVTYLPQDDQKIAIKIVASDIYKAFLQDEAKGKRDRAVKSFVITVSPYAAAGWSLGAAVVVPVISNPTFTTKKVGDKFVIHSTEGDSQPYQIAAMLGIEPREWRQQIFAVGFQIGVSPAKERIAFYVGPHVRLYAVSIGGGLLLQRTASLDDGLFVGKTLDAESDLKTNTRLRPGGYVQASVSLFKK